MHKVSKKYVLSASRHAVYQCLTDQEEFARFTGMPAKMEVKPGGDFSLFGGYISGNFLALYPETRLVMVWRDCYSWEEGIYSIVNIQLDDVDNGIQISWTQHGVPTHEVEHLGVGLGRKYFLAMENYLLSGVNQNAMPDSCHIPDIK